VRPDAHIYVLRGCNGTESDSLRRFALRSAPPVAVWRRRDIRSTRAKTQFEQTKRSPAVKWHHGMDSRGHRRLFRLVQATPPRPRTTRDSAGEAVAGAVANQTFYPSVSSARIKHHS
jgi:hypothetical protein